MDPLQIRRNIKHLRNAKGMTQKEMAEALFMDERTYSNFERGVKKSIDIKLLLAISAILGTDMNKLITDPETEKQKSIPVEEKLQQILNEINDLKEFFLLELKEIRKEVQVQ